MNTWEPEPVVLKKPVKNVVAHTSNFSKKLENLLSDDPSPPKKPDSTLVKRVVDARNAMNLTRSQLALQVGVKESVIRDLETGKTTPLPVVMNRIRRVLKL
jgi:ribosome-binding protein aMBF1 (putative translation factor)